MGIFKLPNIGLSEYNKKIEKDYDYEKINTFVYLNRDSINTDNLTDKILYETYNGSIPFSQDYIKFLLDNKKLIISEKSSSHLSNISEKNKNNFIISNSFIERVNDGEYPNLFKSVSLNNNPQLLLSDLLKYLPDGNYYLSVCRSFQFPFFNLNFKKDSMLYLISQSYHNFINNYIILYKNSKEYYGKVELDSNQQLFILNNGDKLYFTFNDRFKILKNPDINEILIIKNNKINTLVKCNDNNLVSYPLNYLETLQNIYKEPYDLIHINNEYNIENQFIYILSNNYDGRWVKYEISKYGPFSNKLYKNDYVLFKNNDKKWNKGIIKDIQSDKKVIILYSINKRNYKARIQNRENIYNLSKKYIIKNVDNNTNYILDDIYTILDIIINKIIKFIEIYPIEFGENPIDENDCHFILYEITDLFKRNNINDINVLYKLVTVYKGLFEEIINQINVIFNNIDCLVKLFLRYLLEFIYKSPLCSFFTYNNYKFIEEYDEPNKMVIDLTQQPFIYPDEYKLGKFRINSQLFILDFNLIPKKEIIEIQKDNKNFLNIDTNLVILDKKNNKWFDTIVKKRTLFTITIYNLYQKKDEILNLLDYNDIIRIGTSECKSTQIPVTESKPIYLGNFKIGNVFEKLTTIKIRTIRFLKKYGILGIVLPRNKFKILLGNRKNEIIDITNYQYRIFSKYLFSDSLDLFTRIPYNNLHLNYEIAMVPEKKKYDMYWQFRYEPFKLKYIQLELYSNHISYIYYLEHTLKKTLEKRELLQEKFFSYNEYTFTQGYRSLKLSRQFSNKNLLK
jgi:hypothetical protein